MFCSVVSKIDFCRHLCIVLKKKLFVLFLYTYKEDNKCYWLVINFIKLSILSIYIFLIKTYTNLRQMAFYWVFFEIQNWDRKNLNVGNPGLVQNTVESISKITMSFFVVYNILSFVEIFAFFLLWTNRMEIPKNSIILCWYIFDLII